MSNESELIKNTVVEQDTSAGQEPYQESAVAEAGVVEVAPDMGTDWEGETKKFQSIQLEMRKRDSKQIVMYIQSLC